MDLDNLLHHYFETDDLAGVDEHRLARGCEQLALDFAVEREGSRRFALWTLMNALGIAPSPDEAFEDPYLREAAHHYLKAAWRMERDGSAEP